MEPSAARDALRTGKLAVVVVPGDSVTYLYDPTRNGSRMARLLVDRAVQRAAGRSDPVAVEDAYLTEPGSRYIDFLIPGLLGLNLMGSGMWGIGFNIVQARRKKLLKRLLATPMRKSHYLGAFILSRFVFMILEVVALVGFGWLVFDVRVHGSLADLLVVTVIGALAFAGLGLLAASRARTIEGVSGIMNLVMLPMWIFSGVFFSYANFPDAMQPFIKALPLTPLNDALRSVMIDGAALDANLARLGILASWGAIAFAAALRIFRWR
jgi:ABC transporter DrrB family efflux protein